MKKEYSSPKLEIINFQTEEILDSGSILGGGILLPEVPFSAKKMFE